MVMSAEVSRVIAAFVADMGLGQDAARLLARQYGDATFDELPEWLTEDTDDDDEPLARATGHDTHPGGEQLKRYWVYGEGAAKWSTYTELHEHLLKHGVPHADAVAAAWFHLRFGIWPGSDENRVRHGKPPRGHRVGPG